MAWSFERLAPSKALSDPHEILALADRLEYAGFTVTAATLRHLVEELNDHRTSHHLEHGD